jgi:DNA repair protein RadC
MPSVEDRLLTDHLRGRLEALGIRFDGHYVVAGGKSIPVS